MQKVPNLVTERLLVRPFRLDEFDAVHRLLDMEISPPGWTRQERRDWLQWTVLSYDQYALLEQPPYGDRAVVLRESGQLIGSVGYVPYLDAFGQLPHGGGRPGSRNTAEMGLYWAISPAYRRRGFASEAAAALVEYAFAEMGAARLIATTGRKNLASIGVMRRLGMQIDENPFPEPPWLQVVGFLQAPEGQA